MQHKHQHMSYNFKFATLSKTSCQASYDVMLSQNYALLGQVVVDVMMLWIKPNQLFRTLCLTPTRRQPDVTLVTPNICYTFPNILYFAKIMFENV